jgi:hypothetical protein
MIGAQFAQFAGQGLPDVVAAAGDDQPRALAREGQRGGAADAGEGAGDEDDGSGHGRLPSRAMLRCVNESSMYDRIKRVNKKIRPYALFLHGLEKPRARLSRCA